MSDAAKKILAQIEELPDEEQRWLFEVLGARRRTEEGGVTHSDAWKNEILRRVEQVKSGEVKPEPWSEVRKRIREALDKNG